MANLTSNNPGQLGKDGPDIWKKYGDQIAQQAEDNRASEKGRQLKEAERKIEDVRTEAAKETPKTIKLHDTGDPNKTVYDESIHGRETHKSLEGEEPDDRSRYFS